MKNEINTRSITKRIIVTDGLLKPESVYHTSSFYRKTKVNNLYRKRKIFSSMKKDFRRSLLR